MEKPQQAWMIRAGNDNELANEIWDEGAVALGWYEMGDMSNLQTREDFKERHQEIYPEASKYRRAVNAGQLFRFTQKIQQGDYVLTYIKASRTIFIGIAESDYIYECGFFSIDSYCHIRQVKWLKSVSRDDFSASARNSLGSTLTVFSVNDYIDEIHLLATGEGTDEIDTPDEEEAEAPIFYDDVKAKSDELIADLISQLDPYDFQDLVAGVLEAMGFNAKSSPPGPDRGVDILAHPDAFGFESPRIKAQVKHRNSSAGGPEMREFLGSLQPGDNGLYVSTGGFTRDAKMEADVSRHSISLLDRDAFIQIMLEHYDKLNSEYKAQIPLRKVWIPINS